jgi:hypothetical protein
MSLSIQHPKLVPHPPAVADDSFDRASIHASRPCYRCVMYMHSVGIRRVFWTGDDGEWEGAKFRDLVDILNGGSIATAGNSCGIFVTKHEVLMMRRVMGGS